MKQILIELGEAVKNFDADLARSLAEKAVSMGVDPVEALEEGLSKALREIGDRFGRGEAFITELVAGAAAMEAGASVLNAEIAKRGASHRAVGRFLIGTVEGDIHSIGKSIVATMLRAAGFEVIDLGVDVPSSVFVDKARELKPDIIGLSALMTTTMMKQKEIVRALKDVGLQGRVKVIVGGAPVTQQWVEEIGADACGFDASSAVELALRMLKEGGGVA